MERCFPRIQSFTNPKSQYKIFLWNRCFRWSLVPHLLKFTADLWYSCVPDLRCVTRIHRTRANRHTHTHTHTHAHSYLRAHKHALTNILRSPYTSHTTLLWSLRGHLIKVTKMKFLIENITVFVARNICMLQHIIRKTQWDLFKTVLIIRDPYSIYGR